VGCPNQSVFPEDGRGEEKGGDPEAELKPGKGAPRLKVKEAAKNKSSAERKYSSLIPLCRK